MEIFEDAETQMTTASKINLIDLAGSERASQVLNDQVIKTAETAALRLKVRNTSKSSCLQTFTMY